MTREKKKSTYTSSSPAVEQAAQVLLCLGKNLSGEMTLTEICSQVGIHKSKGFSILNALNQHDFVIKDNDTKAYSLGPALMPLGCKAAEKFDITLVAKKHLQVLADETRSSVLLGIISNDQFYIASKYDGNNMLSLTVRQYQSLHITHGAHGKAIFAFLDKTEQKRIIDSGEVFFHGDPQALDQDRLKQETNQCRQNGYAVDNGELTHGISAVSAPIFDHNNRVTAGVVVVGTFSKNWFKEYGEKTAAAARRISDLSGAQIKKI